MGVWTLASTFSRLSLWSSDFAFVSLFACSYLQPHMCNPFAEKQKLLKSREP